MPTHTQRLLYFDRKDYELLAVINHFLERMSSSTSDGTTTFFHTSLHPRGIKELAELQESRIAYAVFNLLSSLKKGQAEDRLSALRSLHDEVLASASTSFRYNTGRVLIQIMKNLVRAHGNFEQQLRLVHDFRKAASGKRRTIRAMLHRYNLLEMPEEWNQLAFDYHVHDANTKGRKSPTHLIMDAWIKGIRRLDVVYYNFIEAVAVKELLEAAKIVDIKVRIGVEFQAQFHGRYVQFIWQPLGFHTFEETLAFMEEKPMQHLIRMGKEASLYHHYYVLRLLERYNERLRHEIGEDYALQLTSIDEKEILASVGVGQTSRTHLAELIIIRLREACKQKYASLSPTAWEQEECAQKIMALTPDMIIDHWLSHEKNPDIELPFMAANNQSVPEIMRLLPTTLIDWLTSIRTPCNIILNLNKLTAGDVLELLYECDGAITHLELFNLKNYANGNMRHLKAITNLQSAINEGSPIALKRLIRTMIKEYEQSGLATDKKRLPVFHEILHHIPTLQGYYTATPLHSRIGSDSTSRGIHSQGMGFVLTETLPAKAQKAARTNPYCQPIAIGMEVYSQTTYYPKRYTPLGTNITRLLRKIPFLRNYNMRRQNDWMLDEKTASYTCNSNIVTLGGSRQSAVARKPTTGFWANLPYWNTTCKNIGKVGLGFALTAATFAYTQSWWVLAWFGPIIWFAITGLRNVLQTMLSAGGLKRSPLLRLHDCISWSRVSDSLMFTGFSVPLLELGVRTILLKDTFDINSMNQPVIFFTIISLVNGAYIASHNIFRGLPAEAVIGNIFRSFLAIPLSIFYGFLLTKGFLLMGAGAEQMLILQQGAAVTSKLASDSVAAIIEGFADKVEYLRMRYWDYKKKLQQLFNDYAQLDLFFPEEDAERYLQRNKHIRLAEQAEQVASPQQERMHELEKRIIITALDLMYLWMYQPRARVTLEKFVNNMTDEERHIFAASQQVLTRVQEISQLLVNGLVGFEFARPLSFYLDKHEEYLKDMHKLLQSYIRHEHDEELKNIS